VTALVLPAKAPAPSSPAIVPAAPSEVKVEVPLADASGLTATDVPDAGAVAVVPPTSEPPSSTGGATPESMPTAEARGMLIVRATPYATVLVSGQKPREVQGTSRYSLPPGSYKVSFQHPSGSETYDVTVTPNGSVTRSFVVRKK